jgi:Raf kinase inhibitor-like YbhB/YbcL family protein
MLLVSDDFKNGQIIDRKFTCDGEDISPHLRWENPPNGTKSYAISISRSDPIVGEIFHWIIYNIPNDVYELEQDGKIPGIEAENDFHTVNYEGPNASEGLHNYIFRIYALNIERITGINSQNFKRIINQYMLEYAELIGLYERKTPPKSTSSCDAVGSCSPFGFKI